MVGLYALQERVGSVEGDQWKEDMVAKFDGLLEAAVGHMAQGERGRRVRKCSIGMNLFFEGFLRARRWTSAEIDVPEDAEVVAVVPNTPQNTIDLYLAHPSFPVVPDGEYLAESVYPLFTVLTFPPVWECEEAFREIGHAVDCSCAACRVISFVKENGDARR